MNSAAKPGVTVPQVVDDLISKGAKIVLTTSDDFKDGTLEAAMKHPDLPIVNVSGDMPGRKARTTRPAKNESNFMGQMEYGKMIAGCAAALTTQTGKIGYLGPLINDETRRLAASAYLGAKYCWTNYAKKDPTDLKFKVTWIGFWFNIPGQTLDPDQGSRRLLQQRLRCGHLGHRHHRGAWSRPARWPRPARRSGRSPTTSRTRAAEAPEVCLGVPYFNWGPAYVKASRWSRMASGRSTGTGTARTGRTSTIRTRQPSASPRAQRSAQDNAAKVDTFIKGLGDGSINLFKGPLNFQDGSVFLKDGEVATDLQIWYLPQLLEGMEGASK